MTHTHHLANAIIIFLASLAAAALIIAALNSPFADVMTTASTIGSSAEAETGRNIISSSWDLAPFITVLLGLIYLVGSAAKESRL